MDIIIKGKQGEGKTSLVHDLKKVLNLKYFNGGGMEKFLTTLKPNEYGVFDGFDKSDLNLIKSWIKTLRKEGRHFNTIIVVHK